MSEKKEPNETSTADDQLNPGLNPPYPGWAPYCLVCWTMTRMKPTSFGWQCVSCRTRTGKDLKHWSGNVR